MYHGPFDYRPEKIEVNEVNSDITSEMSLRVGQKYAHPLYLYKIEITRIKAYKEKPEFGNIYSRSSIFIKPYVVRNSGTVAEMKEYEIEPENINKDKWFLIE
ncbi:TPA: hypothetical protein ACGW67_005472 [Bacillus tropicus]